MSTLIKTYAICGRCLGTKVVSASNDEGTIEIPCESCGATGYFEVGNLDVTDLQTDITKCLRRLKKLMDKLEVTD
jgi:hypothetical protein